MEIQNVNELEAKTIGTLPYRDRSSEVKGVTIKWLSWAGENADSPDYGLRFFAVEPGGNIPIHKHFYVQTMYMLSGHLWVYSHDPESDEQVEEKSVGPDDFIFVPSMEPHSMYNPSDTQEATFLCCIANVYA